MEIEQFLATHGVARLMTPEADDDGTKLMKAYILGQDDSRIKIRHLQTDYLVDKTDILSVSVPRYIFYSDGGGQPAELCLRGTAVVRHAFETFASSFFATAPFAFTVPSWAEDVERTPTHLPGEATWLLERGLLDGIPTAERPLLAAEGTMTDIDTPGQSSPTYCGTATGSFPDGSIDSSDHDDDTDPKATWDGLKNDDPFG